MPKPNDRDWMIQAFCRTAEQRNRWFTDSRRGPMQNYARKLCSPCRMHQPCAAYALSLPELPIGVVVAGVSLSEDTSDKAYRAALDRVRRIAAGGVTSEDIVATSQMATAAQSPSHRAPDALHSGGAYRPEGGDRMIAGQLTDEHVGRMVQISSRGGVLHKVERKLRGTAARKVVDIHIHVNTAHGMKNLVLSPSTPLTVK